MINRTPQTHVETNTAKAEWKEAFFLDFFGGVCSLNAILLVFVGKNNFCTEKEVF
jgi:hypothetical protein